jgi:hypothetical protein
VTVQDKSGASASVSLPAVIPPVVPSQPPDPYVSIAATGSITVKEGRAFSGVVALVQQDDLGWGNVGTGSYFSANVPPSPFAVIDWGDGTASGTVGPSMPLNPADFVRGSYSPVDVTYTAGNTFAISGGHTYADDGTYTITVCVWSAFEHGMGLSPVVSTGIASVSEAPISIGPSPYGVPATSAGQPVRGKADNGPRPPSIRRAPGAALPDTCLAGGRSPRHHAAVNDEVVALAVAGVEQNLLCRPAPHSRKRGSPPTAPLVFWPPRFSSVRRWRRRHLVGMR